MFSGKMNVNDLSEGRVDDVQCMVALTGEDELGLSESSLYRLIVLPIVKGTFDPKEMALYNERHDLLQSYFSLFVQFLTEFGFCLVDICALHFIEYRELYREKLFVQRFVDAAAAMAVEIDLIVEFGKSCGLRHEQRGDGNVPWARTECRRKHYATKFEER